MTTFFHHHRKVTTSTAIKSGLKDVMAKNSYPLILVTTSTAIKSGLKGFYLNGFSVSSDNVTTSTAIKSGLKAALPVGSPSPIFCNNLYRD